MASPADAARWQAVSRLLDAVLDLAPADRATYLDQACAHDPSLRAEIEALLHLEDDDRLEDNAAVFAAPLLSGLAATDSLGAPRSEVDPGSAPRIVAQIGPYRLVRQLGRGGMGAVYLAERADGVFEKQVALKVIRQGLDTQDVLNRFAYERQILATLDHPHIARLYDGGLTPDGRPYFVMEYVDGLPLLTYCDQHRLRTEQRLALFRTVCRAVQYAHQNLVVHRDLKPSNILVTTDGQVKLLDFGIAKLLAEEAEEMEPLTMTGQRLMTPAYAAPEQVQGGPITTATDVYQLGVLLYELLTGQRPYEIKKRVRQEIERAVLHATPERPSTLVRKLGTDSTETASTITTARATSIDGLERKLRGDLDTIVLMALKKDPGRRYASAEQLAEDLRRHGQGLPVVAHRDSAGYRVRKWVQRNRAAAAVTVIIGLLLLSTATLGTVFAVTTARQAAAIEREATRAEQAAAQAEGVNTFLQDILGSANPAEAGYDVTVLQALRRA
ncbi:MAG: serine/threonine-protein kinase, partial [Bacteroidota bacterium]